jgi:urate oxidase
MSGRIVLGDNQYGKAESRVVRIVRDTPRHEIRDLTVSTCLRGDFAAAHVDGDQSAVLPTDTQKQTAYAYAKTALDGPIERYALALARHFADEITPVRQARIEVAEHAWQRVSVAGREHDHTWVRAGAATRTAAVTADADGRAWIVGGCRDLVLFKSTGSSFAGFLTDEYTVLEPVDDRVLSTSLVAQWRFGTADSDVDFDSAGDSVRTALVEAFAELDSKALQQTLFHMGSAALEACPQLVEVRLSAPNIHHFGYDLARFGIVHAGEVFRVDDRPYGLIQAALLREDAADPGPAWLAFG